MTACGKDESRPDRLYIVSTTEDGPAGKRPALPTAQDLDRQLKAVLDPNLSDDDRVRVIENGDAFRAAIPDLYNAMREHPNAVYFVSDPVFDNHDGTLTATLKLDKDGSGYFQTASVHFIAIDGIWKVSHDDLCGLLLAAEYNLPTCG